MDFSHLEIAQMIRHENAKRDKWISVFDRLPEEWKWCWVTDGGKPFPAMYYKKAAGLWTNGDTWEDFNKEVTHWMPIPEPLEVK